MQRCCHVTGQSYAAFNIECWCAMKFVMRSFNEFTIATTRVLAQHLMSGCLASSSRVVFCG